MKVAIITGATSGMGHEAALQIDRQFQSLDEVWVMGRNEERLHELSAQLEHSTREFVMDLTLDEDLEEFEEALAELKPNIRMLFNCAGCGLHGDFAEMNRKDETELIRLNCEGLTAMTSICIPYMRVNSYLIQFASAAAFSPFPGYAVYAASKAYVLSFSRALREELRESGINVTAVCPGPIDTPFFDVSERYGEGISEQKKKMMDRPERVVRKALVDAYLKRPVSVNNLPMAGYRLAAKAVPTGVILAVIRGVVKQIF